jgi:hypothetical protein
MMEPLNVGSDRDSTPHSKTSTSNVTVARLLRVAIQQCKGSPVGAITKQLLFPHDVGGDRGA